MKPLLLAVSKARVPRKERKAPKGWLGAGNYWVEGGPQQGFSPGLPAPPSRLSLSPIQVGPLGFLTFAGVSCRIGNQCCTFTSGHFIALSGETLKSFYCWQWDWKTSSEFYIFFWVNTRGKELHENRFWAFLNEWLGYTIDSYLRKIIFKHTGLPHEFGDTTGLANDMSANQFS